MGVTPRNGKNCTLSHEAKSGGGSINPLLACGFGVTAWRKTNDFRHALRWVESARNRRILRAEQREGFSPPTFLTLRGACFFPFRGVTPDSAPTRSEGQAPPAPAGDGGRPRARFSSIRGPIVPSTRRPSVLRTLGTLGADSAGAEVLRSLGSGGPRCALPEVPGAVGGGSPRRSGRCWSSGRPGRLVSIGPDPGPSSAPRPEPAA